MYVEAKKAFNLNHTKDSKNYAIELQQASDKIIYNNSKINKYKSALHVPMLTAAEGANLCAVLLV